jgi:anhydro-N-acetylmuramic acid kinase
LRRAVGLMSGTSLDGIDVAFLETDGRSQVSAGPALTVPYDETLRARLRSALGGQGPVVEVERDLADAHAAAGGEGAPLDPVFHAGLGAGPERPFAVGASSP